MPIEFRCSRCGKLLRTPDETAGRQAQCPECGTIGTVPGQAAPAAGVESLGNLPPQPAADAGPLGDLPPQPGSPFVPAAGPYQPAGAFGYQSPPDQLRAYAAQRVSGPATALQVVGWLGMILSVLSLIGWAIYIAAVVSDMPLQGGVPFRGPDRAAHIMAGGFYVVASIVWIVLAILIVVGARRMKRLQGYGMAMAAAIIAVIPCVEPCCLLTLPFGIWALVALSDGSVKAAFRS